MADSAKISSLPVWVRVPWLPVEYYDEEWLWSVGNTIGKTIKVDDTTRATVRGRFARICVEIDLEKPLVASYRIRGREGKFQYEGLYDLCFNCGKYGHKEVGCPLAMPKESKDAAAGDGSNVDKGGNKKHQEQNSGGFGPWMVAAKGRRRPPRAQKGTVGTSAEAVSEKVGTDGGKSGAATISASTQPTAVFRDKGYLLKRGGSRFSVLGDEMEVEGRTNQAGEVGKEESRVNNSVGEESARNVEVESLNRGGGDAKRVRISVSHIDLAKTTRPLKGTDLLFRAQAHGNTQGPSSSTRIPLQEVTNSSGTRPTAAKSSRPSNKSTVAQGNANFKSLKRPGEDWRKDVWNGPPFSGPFLFTSGGLLGPGDGSGTRCPPEPPDLSSKGEEASGNPNRQAPPSALGDNAEDEGGPATTCAAKAADAAMAEAVVGTPEVEVVHTTQF